MILEPRLIVTTGIVTAGKTTVARELARRIVNGAYFGRDDAMYWGPLLVNDIMFKATRLPSFEEYVGGDNVFPDHIETVETPFGPMHRVLHDDHPDYLFRHAENQSYLIPARFAERLLAIGKVVVIDAWFSEEYFRNGIVKAYLAQEAFAPYPTYLIHCVVEPEEAFRRLHDRVKDDPEAQLRVRSYLEWDAFLKRMEKEQPSHPEGIDKIPHLRLDTTSLSVEDAVTQCLDYIRS